jgi:xanthine phosphoribosyltransferase
MIISRSWDGINNDARILGGIMQATWNGPPEGIIAIARGGLVPAAIIANLVDCRQVAAVSAESYNLNGEVHPVKINYMPRITGLGAHEGAGWWVIDDILDTGSTLAALQEIWPAALYGVLYRKPNLKRPYALRQLPIAVREYHHEAWVKFPWENT